MSALLAYWVLFAPAYRVLVRLPRRWLFGAGLALWACSGIAALDLWLRHHSPEDAPHAFYRYHPAMCSAGVRKSLSLSARRDRSR